MPPHKALNLPNKPIVVGLYGVPGSGKTTTMQKLKDSLPPDFRVFEGSSLIEELLDQVKKAEIRKQAIDTIRRQCRDNNYVGLVAGHYMFWDEGDESAITVWNSSDAETYTHILYLDVDPDELHRRRSGDSNRPDRANASPAHLEKWQRTEKEEICRVCYHRGILFSDLPRVSDPTEEVVARLRGIRRGQGENLADVSQAVDNMVNEADGKLETVLVFDGDKTLSADDSGQLFWEMHPATASRRTGGNALKEIFSGPKGRSYYAFRQAAWLYQDCTNPGEFSELCIKVAARLSIHPELLSLMRRAALYEHVRIMVVTCGLRRVWEEVFTRYGLQDRVFILGGGRGDLGEQASAIVTPALKTYIVDRLGQHHGKYIWAFGDSPLDLGMLMKANEAVVVTGPLDTRSKSMDMALRHTIDSGFFKPRQVLLPPDSPMRLDGDCLPVLEIDEDFGASVIRRRAWQPGLGFGPEFAEGNVFQARPHGAAKLLQTPMRDASVAGPALREAHRRVGWYLATEMISVILGIDRTDIKHVQGHMTEGFCLRHESETTIVALMRGGEPMAAGVNDAFPRSMFVHAREPDELQEHHLSQQRAVIIVDSVINSGKSVLKFVERIRVMQPHIRVVLVAGVTHRGAVADGPLADRLAHDMYLHLVTLRTSSRQFTGSRATDTGNRLFNTTHLA
ncbi:hypothetical protein GQ53DRAFT_869625 [Thozetella sp. PMI_491]|nr:hypothetical protein GQ53DRAFT_869625 [Thozetella sp. PMI_491]